MIFITPPRSLRIPFCLWIIPRGEAHRKVQNNMGDVPGFFGLGISEWLKKREIIHKRGDLRWDIYPLKFPRIKTLDRHHGRWAVPGYMNYRIISLATRWVSGTGFDIFPHHHHRACVVYLSSHTKPLGPRSRYLLLAWTFSKVILVPPFCYSKYKLLIIGNLGKIT